VVTDTTEPRVFGGRYELERRLARGGMADVYLARDALLDRPVAVKVLFPEFASDPTFVERFRREAQSAANLSHPNIVAVYDWGEEGSTYYIVMEYLEGRSLSEILRAEGALQPDRAADIIIDVAAALGFAHRNGVVHRDVKPGNVLLSPDGHVKVTDFGIARAVSARENLTQTGTVMGTATYFSPEQARGEPVDPRSDVYSLGVVLYELLVGKPPFQSDSPVSVAYMHVSESPVAVRQHNPRVPAPLESVTMHALAKNAANRYASADLMAEDLRNFRAGRPVVAEEVQPVDQLTRGVPIGDVTTVVAAADGTQVLPRTVGPGPEQPPDRRSPAFVIVLVALLALLVALLVVLARNLDSGDDPVLVQVPNLVGVQQDVAEDRLDELGLDVTIEDRADRPEPDGQVVEQTPPEGEEIEEGETVRLVVSRPAPVAVPRVIGDTEQVAEQKLTAVGLVSSIEREENDAQAGRVIDQDPRDGSEAKRGDTVTLTVSAGPGESPVPNVTGQSSAAAANRLGQDGFNVTTVTEPNAGFASGTVIRTDPPAGTALPKGANVTLVVSSGAPTTTTTAPPPTTTTTTTTSTTSPPPSTP
jgi:eukaryotic-like serine/threonine-protein kinase